MIIGREQTGNSPMFGNLQNALKTRNPATETTPAMDHNDHSPGNRQCLREGGIQFLIP